MSPRTFLDTNVLGYLFDGDAPKKRERIRQILLQEDANDTLVVSTQVMQELYAVVTRKFKRTISPEEADRALRRLVAMDVVVVVPDMIFAAAVRSRRDTVNFWDALIVEAALAGGCSRIFTEDFQGGRDFGPVRIVNPFTGHE